MQITLNRSTIVHISDLTICPVTIKTRKQKNKNVKRIVFFEAFIEDIYRLSGAY